MFLNQLQPLDTHGCPTWEYPSKLWSWDLRRACLPCGFALTANASAGLDRAEPPGWGSVQRIERLAQLVEPHRGGTCVMRCPTFFLWCLWWNSFLPFRFAVRVPGPEAKSLVGSHKSRLGLAHCWGWLRFAVEPQPNSPSTVRRRSVYSPEPWPTSGFTVGLHARDIIPSPLLLYHPPHSSSFGSCLFSFYVFPVCWVL